MRPGNTQPFLIFQAPGLSMDGHQLVWRLNGLESGTDASVEGLPMQIKSPTMS